MAADAASVSIEGLKENGMISWFHRKQIATKADVAATSADMAKLNKSLTELRDMIRAEKKNWKPFYTEKMEECRKRNPKI